MLPTISSTLAPMLADWVVKSYSKGKYLTTIPNSDTVSITGYGVDLWTHLLDPIMGWLENEVFVHPVETILEVLPNLLAAIEYNQILPKIQELTIKLGVKIVFNLGPFDLNFYDMFLGSLLNSIGIIGALQGSSTRGAVNSLLDLLFKGTRTQTGPADTYNYSEIHVIDYRYFDTVGIKFSDYCAQNGITDVLVINDVKSAGSQTQISALSAL